MPLTDDNKHLLHEIYQVPYIGSTVISGGYGSTMNIPTSASFDFQRGVREQLLTAIDLIDSDETMVTRVQQILLTYGDIALDRSDINRDGYAFRASKNLRAIVDALFSYTGIVLRTGRANNRLPLG